MKNKVKQVLLPTYLKLFKFFTLYIIPFTYKKNRYQGSFLSIDEKIVTVQLEKAKEILYIFWTGSNDISENRQKSIRSLENNSEVAIQLITPHNLNDYIVKEYPLHPAYEFLSLIQKSDYLRCYFMLHHGGGYADIKPCLNSWKTLFNALNSDPKKWCTGPREKFLGGVPLIEGNVGDDCRKYHNNLISNGAFIYKPNSPLAKEWMKEVHRRLDLFLPDLKKNPGDEYGGENYPIPWSFLAAQIMHPLILKYHDKVICQDIDLFSIENYR